LNIDTYDVNNNEISDTVKSWSGSVWAKNSLYLNTFDVHNNELSDAYQLWIGSAYVNKHIYTNSYNVNNTQVAATYGDYNNAGTKYIQGDSTYYYYHYVTIASLNNLPDEDADIKVYPNPSKGKFTVKPTVVSGQCSVEIYNVLGEKIRSFEVSGQNNEIDLSNQTNGVYLYRVVAENGELVGEGKLIIQK